MLPLINTAVAFRGYNVTNLGRTAELLAVPAYRDILRRHLDEASEICRAATGKPVNLLERVTHGEEADLAHYAEAVALVYAVELAQLELAREVRGLDLRQSRFFFGYSLGELVAVAASGMYDPRAVLEIPLSLAEDCVALTADATMGIVFSRAEMIVRREVERLCEIVTTEGLGTIAVSSWLAPNSLLVIGQRETLARFGELAPTQLSAPVHIRPQETRWPPLHTPIMWQKQISDRAAVQMERVAESASEPKPPVFSLVTGGYAYNAGLGRRTLRSWVDHPQNLWSAVSHTLSSGIETVVHVGPAPNLIPATFARLSENVCRHTGKGTWANFSRSAVSGAARYPWLANLLPERAFLLRAPQLKQVILEDWLLDAT
jgi:[acyl-carrier-protein] S-malonyltransferase